MPSIGRIGFENRKMDAASFTATIQRILFHDKRSGLVVAAVHHNEDLPLTVKGNAALFRSAANEPVGTTSSKLAGLQMGQAYWFQGEVCKDRRMGGDIVLLHKASLRKFYS